MPQALSGIVYIRRMSKIESKRVTVKAAPEQIYSFLSDMNNIKLLLPLDKISDWKSSEDSCSFKVQGAYTIGLQRQEGIPHSQIRYGSGPGGPFPFELICHLQASGSTTEGYMVCDAQLNPFLEMMVKSPLKNLFDYMADRLVKVHEQ